MSLNRANSQYALSQFDAGVPPHQILLDLQYRAFLPSINITTVERCLYENSRLPPARPGPPAASQNARQLPTSPAVGSFGTDDFADPGPTLPWDTQTGLPSAPIELGIRKIRSG